MNPRILFLPVVLTAAGTASARHIQTPPNIVVILADDLGFSDPGCFGGEIETPVLDRLAAEGLRLTQLYNSGRSCPSRACLLTGLYPHRVGIGEMVREHREAWPEAYRGYRQDNNLTIAEALRAAGYHTAMAGKWHMGKAYTPVDCGFDDVYGFLNGAMTYWNPERYVRLPKTAPQRDYARDEFYATDAITDYAIDFAAQARERNKPLFLHVAYNAPHFPLQAPRERIDHYMAVYLKGWDAIREEREVRLRQLGLLSDEERAAGRGEVPASQFIDRTRPIPAWDTLSEEQQHDLARRMAIYAAMVDIMDRNIGRLIEALRDNGQLENTLILFLSDNGACAEWHEFGFDGRSGTNYHIHTADELAGMGQPGTYHHYGTGWANVCCTPFRLYKHFAHEGGISSPSILWWGDRVKHPGGIDHQPCHLIDIMATCLDAAVIAYPEQYEQRQLAPTEGISLLPLAQGRSLPNRPIFAEQEGNRMVRLGRWKLVASYYNGQQWELYDIAHDRTEQHNLSARHPRRVNRMAQLYFRWADANGVLPYPQLMNEYGGLEMKIYNKR